MVSVEGGTTMKKIVKSVSLVIAGLVAGVMVIPALANTALFSETTSNQMLSEQEAIEIALNNTVETFEVVSVELDDLDDDPEYELLLRNDLMKVEVEIDAYSGEIEEWEVELLTNNSTSQQSIISFEQAEEIALNKAGSGYVVVSIELEDDDDDDYEQEYELELRSDRFKVDVEIDAYTGQITEWEAEAINTSSSATIISRERAIEIALNKAGSGFEVIEVEFDDDDDDDDDMPEYEIELRSSTQEIDVEINAITGEIIEWEVETYESTSQDSTSTMITRERAIAIAREKIGSTPVLEEIELDDDDNQMIYELEFEENGKEYEFEIDAYTGQILEFEIDD